MYPKYFRVRIWVLVIALYILGASARDHNTKWSNKTCGDHDHDRSPSLYKDGAFEKSRVQKKLSSLIRVPIMRKFTCRSS